MAKEPDELEVWENAGLGTIYLRKYNSMGHPVHEPVLGRRKLFISPIERRINQEMCANDALDPFKNGSLVPVRLIDSEPDAAELQANSNAMSETKMKALFRSQLPTFTTKVNEISNPSALRRLVEVASEVDASIRQLEVIERRLGEVSPQVFESGVQQIAGTSAIGTKAPQGENRLPKGVTPK